MTGTDRPSDPDGGDPSDGADHEGRNADGRDHTADAAERGSDADPSARAEPRLANASTADDDEDPSVADPKAPPEPEPIEPEPLRAENALFVLLGALGTVGLLATAVVPALL